MGKPEQRMQLENQLKQTAKKSTLNRAKYE